MRRFLLIFIFMLNFSTLNAVADDPITEITATDINQDVNIDIPDDLPSGYHIATADVTDPETGEVTSQDIEFCKDTSGDIHWDNYCPDLEAVVDPATLENVTTPDELPAYSPASEPEKTSQTQVAGFTALSVLSAGGAAAASAGLSGGSSGTGGSGSGGSGSGGGGRPSSGGGSGSSRSRSSEARRDEREENPDSEHEGDDEESSEKLLHAAHAKQSSNSGDGLDSEDLVGIGDQSFTWKAPLTPTFDSMFIVASLRVSKFSPLLAKIFIDASYLRAMFGSISIFTVPLGFTLGFQALMSSHSQAMPPAWKLMAAMAILGLVDSFAGLISTLVFVFGIALAGNINSLSQLLTVLTYAAICASPAIIAGSFRPLRRKVGIDEHPWERVVDYLLASILTGWTLSKFVGTLIIIAGKQFPISGHASEIGVIIGIAVLMRMGFEDLSTYFYPQRTSKFNISFEKPSKIQQYISLLLKASVFAIIMKTFVGFNIQLIIGTAFFIVPNIIKLSVGHILPKSRLLHFAVPKGAIRIIAMTILGTLFAALSKKLFTNPHDFLTWGFVLLSLPGFALSILGLVSDDKNYQGIKGHGNGKWLYRLGGPVILFFIVQIVLGQDIVGILKNLFGLK
jgi:hypothetical protein